MGTKADFKLAFPLFVLACTPAKKHPVKNVTVIDAETEFATFEVWGDLFLKAFTSHSRLTECLKLDGNRGRLYPVLFTKPSGLRNLILMLRDHQSLKVGVIFDPDTPDLRYRLAHSEVLRLT
jgi:hypothetical protein